MGMFFLGLLRSGTIGDVQAALRGLEVEVAGIPPFVPGSGAFERPPTAVDFGPRMMASPGYVRTLIAQVFPEDAWEHAAAIAYAESTFDPNAHNTNGEDSRGLFQINIVPAANPDLLALGDLFDPAVNVRAAYIVWERQGWRAWLNTARAMGVPLTGPGIP